MSLIITISRNALLLFFCLFSAQLTLSQINWGWARDGGYNSEFSTIYDICSDAQGNIYVTGAVSPGATINGQPLTILGSRDVLIAKYNDGGQLIWKKTAGTAFPVENVGKRIITDNAGHLYVCGCLSGTVQFGSFSVSPVAGGAFFLVKMDTAGNYLWAKDGCGGTSVYTDKSYGLQADNYGNLYLSANLGANQTLMGSVTNPNFSTVPAVVKLNANGDVIWSYVRNASGSPSFSSGYCTSVLKLDKQGQPILAAPQYRGPSNIYRNLFIAKLDTGGAVVWQKEIGDTTMKQWDCSPASMDFDEQNNIYLGGMFYSKLCLLPGNPAGGGGLLAKFDTDGNTIWAKKMQIVSNNTASVFGLNYFPNSDSLYCTGYYRGTTDFGGISVTTNGSVRMFIANYDTTGAINWLKSYGRDSLNSVTMGQCAMIVDSVYVVAGAYAKTIDLGSQSLNYTSGVPYDQNFFIASTKQQTSGILIRAGNKDFDFSVYPNPATDVLLIDFSGKDETYDVDVFSFSGQKVLSLRKVKEKIMIPTQGYVNGNYFIQVTSGDMSFTKRVVIAK